MENNEALDLKDFENEVLQSIEVLQTDIEINIYLYLLNIDQEQEKIDFEKITLAADNMVASIAASATMIPAAGAAGAAIEP